MRSPIALIRFIGRALLSALGGGILGDALDFMLDVAPEMARDLADWWAERDDARRRAELQALAQSSPQEMQSAVEEVVNEIAPHESERVRHLLTAYLTQLPATVRRTLRRPADPTGTTVPVTLVLHRPEDLLPFLPSRLPRYRPGDRPLPEVERELVELLGVGSFGEVWKASTPDTKRPFVALKFCIDPQARDMWRHEAALLKHVMAQGRQPGIIPLLDTYLYLDPPCLEYEYVAGGDLAGVIREWHGKPPLSPARLVLEAAHTIRDLASIVAVAHRTRPPIVHRDLKPANILAQPGQRGSVRLWVTDFGIGGIVADRAIAQTRLGTRRSLLMTALRGAHTPLYASPQQARGEPPDPRDDIYALGVIWHQMLTGDLTQGRPGGARWLKRLAELGMSPGLRDLLGACFEDDRADRPPDAGTLAEAITTELSRPNPRRTVLAPDAVRVPRVGKVGRLEGHAAPVEGLAFSPDGHRVLSGGADQTVRLWDVEMGRELRRFGVTGRGIVSVAFAPSGRQVAFGGWDKMVHLADTETGWERHRLDGHRGRVLALAWLSEQSLLSAGSDRAVQAWDAHHGRATQEWIGPTDLAWNTAAFSADGQYVLSGAADGAVRLWDTRTGELLRSFVGVKGPVLAVTLSTDSRLALAGGWDRTVTVWDVATGQERGRLEGHQGWVWGLDVSPDGDRILSGGADHTVRLWDLVSGRELLRFEGHGRTVQAVAFSPDGRLAASGGLDGAVCLWGLPVEEESEREAELATV